MPLNPTAGPSVHVVAASANGGIWHAIRFPSSRTGLGDVKVASLSDPGFVRDVAAAGREDLQVCTTTDMLLHHAIRFFRDGNWTQLSDVEPEAGGVRHGFNRVASAVNRANGSLHVFGVGTDGNIWHTIRDGLGNWTQFEPVSNRGDIVDVACAMDAEAALHVCGVSTDGQVHHALFVDNGPPSGFSPVFNETGVPTIAGTPQTVTKVACGVLRGALHVVVASSSGAILHALRKPDGNWTGFGDVKGEAGDPGAIGDVAAAVSNNGGGGEDLNVFAIVPSGELRRTTRFNNGSWEPFQNASDEFQTQESLVAVACASIL
jgi:hypothetical protein